MGAVGRRASLINSALMTGSLILLATFLSACEKPSEPGPVQRSEAEVVSPERQAYLKAMRDYNDFVDHPKGHVYNVQPREPKLELCYLSAQVVATSVKVPELAADRNLDGEINEWRKWIDIRKYSLHC